MPEGPEVRRYADALAAKLENQTLLGLTTRLKTAKSWLAENPEIVGRKIRQIRAHGKHIIGEFDGDFYFHSHLMMWGSWHFFDAAPPEIDRRERARIVTHDATAILFSAPTFALGRGNPREQIEILRELGTDILPYAGDFDEKAFLARLLEPENLQTTIGAALLNQQIVAGIGNYLRAEILFNCRLDPWRKIGELGDADIDCLLKTIPHFGLLAYQTGGFTVTESNKQRLLTEPGLAYKLGSEWGARHYVFRRTNLPCLTCGEKVRQKHQITRADDENEKTRIIYFCPECQKVDLTSQTHSLAPKKKRIKRELPS